MGAKHGFEAKLYYKVGGYEAAGDFTELTNARDVTLTMDKSKADATTRGNNGFKANKSGLKDASVEFQMVWDADDAGFGVIHDAYFNGDVIGIAVMDGAIATGNGLLADMEIFKFTRNEPLDDVITVDIEMAPSYSANAPVWYEGGASPTGTY